MMSATQYAGLREEVKEVRTGGPPITGNGFTTGADVGVTCVGLQTQPTHESCRINRANGAIASASIEIEALGPKLVSTVCKPA